MLRSLLFVILLVILLNQATADEGDGLADGGTGIVRSRVKRQNIFQQILDLLQLIMTNQNKMISSLNIPPTTAAPTTPPVSFGPYMDCTDVFNRGRVEVTGQQIISPADELGSFLALCDMQTAGGGWTIIQSRQIDATTIGENSSFYKNWAEYESGFGNIGQSSDFWLGLEKIYRLTKQGTYELQIELENEDGVKGVAMFSTSNNVSRARPTSLPQRSRSHLEFKRTYELLIELEKVDGIKGIATYQSFSIGDSTTNYALSIGSYTGAPAPSVAAGDSLSYHNNHPFSTEDQDNDGDSNFNCAADVGFGGWWYIPRYCYYADLNGAGAWYTFDVWKTLKSTKMMIRRVPSK